MRTAAAATALGMATRLGDRWAMVPIAQPRPNRELTSHRDALWAPVPRGRIPLNHRLPGRCEAAREGFEPPSEVAPAPVFKTAAIRLNHQDGGLSAPQWRPPKQSDPHLVLRSREELDRGLWVSLCGGRQEVVGITIP